MCKYADFNLWAPYVPSDDAYSNTLHMNQTSTDTKNLDAWFVGRFTCILYNMIYICIVICISKHIMYICLLLNNIMTYDL